MKMNIEPLQFFEMVKNQYSLDYVYLLKLLKEEVDVKEWCESSERFATLHTSLLRRGLINEEDKITLVGKELVAFAESEGEKIFVKKKVDNENFLKWWASFPGTDSFEYDGVRFVGHRTLRQDKQNCLVKFNKILLEGEYTAEQLTDALLLDVKRKKEASLKTRQNKLSYMQNSLTYLNQRSYEAYIEMLGEKEEDDRIYNGTEI